MIYGDYIYGIYIDIEVLLQIQKIYSDICLLLHNTVKGCTIYCFKIISTVTLQRRMYNVKEGKLTQTEHSKLIQFSLSFTKSTREMFG